VGEFFWDLELKFLVKSSEQILQLATISRQKDETFKMLTGGFSSLKRILKSSQTWKLPIGIFIRWKVLRHSMRRFCYGFL
jgi:hypothetical protein